MAQLPFRTQPVDAGFFETAPLRLQERFDIARPAADIWAELTADDTLGWCRILNEVLWTSPRPFGIGTTRWVKSLHGVTNLDEYFFRWEEGRRKSFYVARTNSPLFRRFAEDYLVEPTGETSCSFTWTIAAEPRALARVGGPLNRAILRTLLDDTRRHFATS